MLDLMRLKTFQVVAATRNFTRAAAELGYSQSSITTHVQLLERELGTQLLDRATRNIALTEAGRKALEYADRLLTLANEAAEAICSSAELSGSVTLSVPGSLAAYRMPDLLRRFQEIHPGVNLELSSHSDSESQVDALLAEQADLAFVVGAPLRSGKLTTSLLGAEEILIVAAPDSPAAGLSEFKLESLSGHQLLLSEKNCPFRQLFERVLASKDIPLRKTLTFANLDAIKEWAMAGIGLGVVPRSIVTPELEQNALVALPWHSPGIHADIQMLRRRSATAPAIQAMWDFLETSFRGLTVPASGGRPALEPIQP